MGALRSSHAAFSASQTGSRTRQQQLRYRGTTQTQVPHAVPQHVVPEMHPTQTVLCVCVLVSNNTCDYILFAT